MSNLSNCLVTFLVFAIIENIIAFMIINHWKYHYKSRHRLLEILIILLTIKSTCLDELRSTVENLKPLVQV